MRIRLFSLFAIASLLVSCAHTDTNNQCVPAPETSVFRFEDFAVYIYGGNDDSNPDIWEEPVCIERKKRSICKLDLSLIKGVGNGPGGLRVQVFSGSNERVLDVDIERCSVGI